MGDVYEFTTWPKHQNLFYKIINSALVFNIKGERNAAIGLAKHPGECEYWVLIGVDQQCWIKKNNGRCCCSVSTQNILSRDKYKKFWITLNKGEIRLGRGNNKNPILSQQISIENLHYVTFSNVGERNHLQWKLHLPPQIQKPTLVRLTGGEPHWIKADKQLPDGALIGGHEDGVLYIIRAHHRGSLTPGKFVPELGLGFVSWGCAMHEKSDFEVLCGYNCTWVKTVKNEIPVGAVEGGYSEDDHEILYVGRAFYDNHLIPGKVQPSHNCCYIPYQEKEIGVQTYEILVLLHHRTDCTEEFFVPDLGIRNMSNYSYDSERSHDEDYEEDEDNEFFDVPPQIEKPTLVRLTGGEPHWIKADKQLPDGALIGGHEDGVLYIIRAHHRGSLTPGKFVPELGLGFVSWGRQMLEKSDFEVLCGYNYTWVKSMSNEIPVGAVEGGYSEDDHEILYVGRAFYDNHLIPGSVQPSHDCCYIPYQKKTIGVEIYEILVLPHMTHIANEFYVSDLNRRNISKYSYDSERSDDEDYEEDEDNEFFDGIF